MKIYTAICLILALTAAVAQADGRCQNVAEGTALKFEQGNYSPDYTCSLKSPSEPGETTAAKEVYVVHIQCTVAGAHSAAETSLPLAVDIDENGACGSAHLVNF